ncbi:sensor domain-containing protein [Chelativorans salis]|uniref:EAL domain-containing protein n=1 Tax=Chelativorans salis TaxID=2978478 RepID=A0ABT2LKR7_9HYPH|nr:EAL domain-containing protein [Chelativorans sp. EGI FJ00035]MCT7374639.1 EAL domain-containing protein [Chelativorans sp. EGI FJ00035]
MSIGIIVMTAAGLALDLRDRRSSGEAARMRELANAAVEGLVVCDNMQIVEANHSFTSLACPDGSETVGKSLEAFFPTFTLDKLSSTIHAPLEAPLRVTDGNSIPVELIRHDIIYSGKPHQVLAVRDIRERKRAEEEIYFLAHHDPLTALPNRTSFNKKLEDELASNRGTGKCVAVLLLDLDRFKEINDLFGHLTGDAVLQFVAGKIKGVLRPGQMVARLGGDEFALIAPGLPSPEYAALTAEAILDAFDGDGEGLPSGATVATSIGIAVFPNDAADGKTLLNYADAALYEAKSDGRGVFRFFEPSMGACLRNRRQLEHDIRHAIMRDELSVAYQPQADLQSSQVFGFEALLRWNHATRGHIPPAEFIPMAEECGAILQIGEWVLRTACAEAVRWERPLAIAVNVSVMQLHSGNLPELVDEILRETGLEPSRLELEITESTLIKDVGRALEALGKLKALGVRIAMDDFGTGYSSLTNLRAFPFDKIKVDRSFIRSVHTNEEAAAIMRAVFGLARGLRLPVLAEGVETEGELSFLRQEGCDAMQGYFLAHPAPIAEFEQYTSQTGIAATHQKHELHLLRQGAA